MPVLKSCYLCVKIRWNWVAVNTLKTCIPNASSSRGPFKYVAKTMTGKQIIKNIIYVIGETDAVQARYKKD